MEWVQMEHKYMFLLGTCLVPKKFAQNPSHRMFRHMHGALNVVEKITNYTVWMIHMRWFFLSEHICIKVKDTVHRPIQIQIHS